MVDEDPRFGGVGRLYGEAGLARLKSAHVAIVGIGGVGSWAVEALARSGVGALTLIDLDDICITNTNRQIHALEGQVGRSKVEAMADRVQLIHPECTVTPVQEFFTQKTAEDLLGPETERRFDCVLEAIDRPRLKALMLAMCRARGIGAVTVGGAGGRRDPASIRRADLTATVQDGLLRETRKRLRRQYGFDPQGPWDIPAVYSVEKAVYPTADGRVCDTPEARRSLRIDCATGFGTAAFVTGAFGLAAAASVVDWLIGSGDHPTDPRSLTPDH